MVSARRPTVNHHALKARFCAYQGKHAGCKPNLQSERIFRSGSTELAEVLQSRLRRDCSLVERSGNPA
jgi:hypothetical protein